MQKILALAVLTIVVLTCANSDAAVRRVRTTNNGYSSAQTQQGPVARLMELERRKNAALRQMFFGR